MRKRMREVAILDFDGGLISALREYWSSQEIPQTTLSDEPTADCAVSGQPR
jgi:hypothetical protein